MAKKRLAVSFRLPAYRTPPSEWRAQVHTSAKKAFDASGVCIAPEDLIELDVRLYLSETELKFHDVDNRLKDIMDALQGLTSGSGTKRRGRKPLLPNDCQVWRAQVEKCLAPKQSHGIGHVRLRRYTG